MKDGKLSVLLLREMYPCVFYCCRAGCGMGKQLSSSFFSQTSALQTYLPFPVLFLLDRKAALGALLRLGAKMAL